MAKLSMHTWFYKGGKCGCFLLIKMTFLGESALLWIRIKVHAVQYHQMPFRPISFYAQSGCHKIKVIESTSFAPGGIYLLKQNSNVLSKVFQNLLFLESTFCCSILLHHVTINFFLRLSNILCGPHLQCQAAASGVQLTLELQKQNVHSNQLAISNPCLCYKTFGKLCKCKSLTKAPVYDWWQIHGLDLMLEPWVDPVAEPLVFWKCYSFVHACWDKAGYYECWVEWQQLNRTSQNKKEC